MKRFFVCIISALLAGAMLISCTPKTGDPTDQTTGDGGETTTAGPQETTGSATEETKPFNPGVDIMKIELSDYVILGDYKKSVTNNVNCDDEELAERLILLAKEQGYYTEVKDRVTKKGDTVNINFAGRVENVYFEGGTASNVTLDLVEENGYIECFDADLYGIVPGTKVETTVTFPTNYHNTDLAGLEAVFEITLNYIYDFTLTDDAIKDITDEKYTDVETFKEAHRKEVIISNINNYEANVADKILESALATSEIKSYPQQLVDYWYDRIMSEYAYYASNYGISVETYMSYLGVTKDAVQAEARRYAKRDLVLHAIFVAEGLTMSDAEYRVELTSLAVSNGYSSAEDLESRQGEFYMRSFIINNLCLKHLSEKITVETDLEEYKHLIESGAETTTGEAE